MRFALTMATILGCLVPGLAAAQDYGPRIHAGDGIGGLFSEVRLGAIAHDLNATESSFAVNGEVLFASPVPARLTADIDPMWRWMLQPRPHLGFMANTGGKTSKGYFGLTWTAILATEVWRPGDAIRFDFLFGGSINDGKHNARLPDRKDLGGNLLFHVGAEIAYQIDPTWSIGIYVDHDSNGGTATRNQGLNAAGLRLGYAL